MYVLFSFVQPAPFEHQPRQLVRERQLLEHFDGRRGRARLAGLLQRRQLQLLEQDFAELLRRVDVELLACQLVDARGVLGELLFDVLRLRGERRAVDPDARALDVGEHRDQRHLEVAVDVFELVGHEQRRKPVGQLPREVGAFAGEGQSDSGASRANGRALAPRPHTSSSVSAL